MIRRTPPNCATVVRVAPGSLIARENDETPIEKLVIGDMVIDDSARVNGSTIGWVLASALPARVTCCHIETEDHDMILANGAPAEMFVDAVGRAAFDNHGEYLEHYGVERIIPGMDRPRISAQRLLPEARRARLGIGEAIRSMPEARIA